MMVLRISACMPRSRVFSSTTPATATAIAQSRIMLRRPCRQMLRHESWTSRRNGMDRTF